MLFGVPPLSARGAAAAIDVGGLKAVLEQLDAEVVTSDELSPAEEADFFFDDARLHRLSNGARLLELVVVTTQQRSELSVVFTVDPAARIYGTAVLLGSPSRRRDPSAIRDEGAEDLADCSCPDVCSGNWNVWIETLDPAFIGLTRTTAGGAWSRYENIRDTGCEWRGNGVTTCWAANPSEAGTHWFTTGCFRTGPTTFDGYFYIRGRGTYINWDFGDDGLSTTVNQWAEVELHEELGVITRYFHSDAGEFSSLIFGWFTQEGYNTCF